MKKIIIGTLACAVISGCGSDTLDWDNARISGGMVYSGNENNPFSGYLTNAPGSVVIPQDSVESRLLLVHFLNIEPADRKEVISMPHLLCNLDISNGVRDGEAICKNKNNITRWKGSFNEGLADGEWAIYDTKGNLSLSANFSEGKLDGRLDIYNPTGSGKLLSKGYKDGLENGTEEIWTPDGNKKLSTTWKNGKENGLHREWWDSGKPKLEIPLEDGNQAGLATYYEVDGSTRKTVTPFDGGYARVTVYEKDGSISLYNADTSGRWHEVAKEQAQQDENSSYSNQNEGNNLKEDHGEKDCVDSWIAYAHKLRGDDIMIGFEQIKDWEDMCSDGQYPPAE